MAISVKPALIAPVTAALVLLALLVADPPRAYAGCNTLSVDGKLFVFYKQGIACKKAKGLARLTYRSNKPPPGWRCPDASPGNNRRDGAGCTKVGDRDKFYGYHAFD